MRSSITHDQTLDVEAEAYRRDVPAAEVHVLDAGHFALDEQPALIADLTRRFLQRGDQVEEAGASVCRPPTLTPATAPVSMITSLTTTSLVHGSLSSSSLPVTVKIASGGSRPAYPSILGCPRSSVLMMIW
jgi:hypothetical protein